MAAIVEAIGGEGLAVGGDAFFEFGRIGERGDGGEAGLGGKIRAIHNDEFALVAGEDEGLAGGSEADAVVEDGLEAVVVDLGDGDADEDGFAVLGEHGHAVVKTRGVVGRLDGHAGVAEDAGFDGLVVERGDGEGAGGLGVEVEESLAAVADAVDDDAVEVDDVHLGEVEVVAVMVHAGAPFVLEGGEFGAGGDLGEVRRGDVGEGVEEVAHGLGARDVIGHELRGVEKLTDFAGLVEDEGLEVVLFVVEDAVGGEAVVKIAGEEQWDEGDTDKPEGQLGKEPPVTPGRRRARRRARHS